MTDPNRITAVSAERLLAESPHASTDVPGEVDAAAIRGWWSTLSDEQFASVWVAQVIELAGDGLKLGALAAALCAVRDRYRDGRVVGVVGDVGDVAGPASSAARRKRRRSGEAVRGLRLIREALALPGVPPEGVRIRALLESAGMLHATVATAIAAARSAEDLDVHRPDGSAALYARIRREAKGDADVR